VQSNTTAVIKRQKSALIRDPGWYKPNSFTPLKYRVPEKENEKSPVRAAGQPAVLWRIRKNKILLIR
jgi:hypothetical protein